MLTKESVKKLRIVKKAILAQPEFYSQERWVSTVEPCGTTCCLAGWADFIFNGEKVHQERAKKLFNSTDRSFGCEEWEEVTAKALGLTATQTTDLTSSSYSWPYPFCEEYELARTPKERAAVAARRIEHFIATGGDE